MLSCGKKRVLNCNWLSKLNKQKLSTIKSYKPSSNDIETHPCQQARKDQEKKKVSLQLNAAVQIWWFKAKSAGFFFSKFKQQQDLCKTHKLQYSTVNLRSQITEGVDIRRFFWFLLLIEWFFQFLRFYILKTIEILTIACIDNFISKSKIRFLRMSNSFCCTHCSLTSALSKVNVHNKISEGTLLESTTPELR